MLGWPDGPSVGRMNPQLVSKLVSWLVNQVMAVQMDNKNTYELLNPTRVYGQDILCEILKVPFEIPHRISYPYIERCVFYSDMKM